MFFYLTGWIKSAPTYSYPRWIVVALIFIFAEMFNLHYSDRLQELCFVLIFVGHQKLSLILNVADMRQ